MDNTDKLPEEIATEEVNKWLEYKKIGKNKREGYKDQIKNMVDDFCEGNLILKEDFKIVQKLNFPLDGLGIKELEFSPRLSAELLHNHLAGAGAGSDARIKAHIAALTTKSKAIIGKLDTVDYNIAQNITIFFM